MFRGTRSPRSESHANLTRLQSLHVKLRYCRRCGLVTTKRFWLKRDLAKAEAQVADIEQQLALARAQCGDLEGVVALYRAQLKKFIGDL